MTGKGRDRETEKIKRPLDELRNAAAKSNVSEQLEPYIKRIETYDEMRETMLRAGLSGLGLAIVFHEIEHGVRALFNALEAGEDSATVRGQAKELVRILDGFSELLRKGDSKTHSILSLLRRAKASTASGSERTRSVSSLPHWSRSDPLTKQ